MTTTWYFHIVYILESWIRLLENILPTILVVIIISKYPIVSSKENISCYNLSLDIWSKSKPYIKLIQENSMKFLVQNCLSYIYQLVSLYITLSIRKQQILNSESLHQSLQSLIFDPKTIELVVLTQVLPQHNYDYCQHSPKYYPMPLVIIR